MVSQVEWKKLHDAAKALLQVLQRIAGALKTGDNVAGRQIYARLPGSITDFRNLIIAAQAKLANDLGFGAISQEETVAKAYIDRLIAGAPAAMITLSGYGSSDPQPLNRWYNDLHELVQISSLLAGIADT